MPNSEFSTSELQRIDSICHQFESAWKSGQSPDLDAVARSIPDKIRQSCLIELVILDAFYRHQSGASTSAGQNPISTDHSRETKIRLSPSHWNDYVQKFPELVNADCPLEFDETNTSSLIGERFRITGLRATGGLGRVSIADDLQFGRSVAVKEIRAKYADRQIYRERFLREAEITGRLEHPSIVPVYAMGEQADGQPYYAMRLIQGRSLLAAINDYHSRHETGLTVDLRKLLQRLIDIGDAVEYAHSRDVIHRDIKPENIMLGDYGETLLVDWGLAKIVGQPEPSFPVTNPNADLSESQTRIGAVLGTPAYMSPEQAAGEIQRIDRRSDVFSLGATLHHLVIGRVANFKKTNGDSKTYWNSNTSSNRRNALSPLVAIALKAMAINPDERYPTARAFSKEIEMYLADQPVTVFRDPIETRIWRWIRHHRAVAGAAAAAVCMLMVASLVFSWLTGIHSSEVESKNAQLDKMVAREIQLRTEAEQSEKRTVDALHYLVGALRSPDPNLDGREIKVVEILNQAVEQLDADFSDDPLMLAQMLHAIGITFKGLGQFAEAKNLVERAHSIYASKLGPENRDTLKTAAKLADLFQRLGDERAVELINDVLETSRKCLDENDRDRLEFRRSAAIIQMHSGNAGEAAKKLEQLVPIFENKFGPDSSITVSLLNDLANAYHLDGRSGEAAAISKKVYESRLEEDGAQSLTTITNGSNYAIHLLNASDRKQAKVILEQLLTISRSSLGDDHFQTLAIMSQLGSLHVNNNDLSQGIELLKESRQRSEQAYGSEHARTLVAANGLGVAYLESGDYQDAAQQLKTVYDASVKTRGSDHPETLTVANNLASAYRLDKNLDSAIEIFEVTVAAQKKRQGSHHPNTLRSMLNLAVTMQQASRPGDSIPVCQEVYQLASEHLAKDSGQAQTALSLEAMAHLELKNFQQAKTVLAAGLESRTRTIPTHWLRYNTMSLLGQAHLELGELAEAEPLLLEAYENMLKQKSKIPARAQVRLDQARQRLFDLYQAKNMPEKASIYRKNE